MDYKYLNNSVNSENQIFPDSDKIDKVLLKNNEAALTKALDFLKSDKKVLHVHGFLGTGKRQFIHYLENFLNKETIVLKYYCKEGSVCDDILLNFINVIETNPISKAIRTNSKIIMLTSKLNQYITSIRKPFLIILHTFDDMQSENLELLVKFLQNIIKSDNIKLIISTKALSTDALTQIEPDEKIFLKALTKDNFKLYLQNNGIVEHDTAIDDFYKYTRGYYYYLALSVKILQSLKINITEFAQKFNSSEMSFDNFLGQMYLTFIPKMALNLFWFLKTIRHGISTDALIDFEIYDESSINYLESNLIIFSDENMLYVQDYFLKQVEMIIPAKTEIKLHKYIINLYEKQLGLPPDERVILLSRQALRSEIEYHKQRITFLEENKEKVKANIPVKEDVKQHENSDIQTNPTTSDEIFKKVNALIKEKKHTEALEMLRKICEAEGTNNVYATDAKLKIAQIYKEIGNYTIAAHYYDAVLKHYKDNNESISLKYLYYELADLYLKTYKLERAVETIKQVIYSVETPPSLMLSSCFLLGNIYLELNNQEEACIYYKKVLDSLDLNTNANILPELYFKYGLANDDLGNFNLAFEFYNKCISLSNNPYVALAYSNLASCYYENQNIEDAKDCFIKAFNFDKQANNYEGIYYNSQKLAEIFLAENSVQALDFLLEAKKSADFINNNEFIISSSIALGDYYYNFEETKKAALVEYFGAKKLAQNLVNSENITKIDQRIADMRLRMNKEDFEEIEKKYAK